MERKEVNQMRYKKVLMSSVVVLGIVSLGGAAVAARHANHTHATAKSESGSAVDTDNVQQGDQTAPDTVTTGTAAKAGTVRQGDQTAPDPAGSQQESSGSDPGSESSGTESESSSESGAPSDGPGGHADPPGNVDHQFNGEE